MSTEYRIFETRQFQKDLDSIAKAGRAEIARKLRGVVYPELCLHPYYGPHIRKLKGYSPDTWRYRIGAWRFFYEIDQDEQIIFMIAAAHRSSAY